MPNQDHHLMVLPPSSPSIAHPLPQTTLNYSYKVNPGKSLRDYLDTLLKRKWWVIASFFIIFLGVALFDGLQTPIYRATAKLQITQDNPAADVSFDDKLSKLSGSSDMEKFQKTQYKILQSESLALRIIKSLQLMDHPDFKSIKKNNPDKSKTEIEELMIAAFLKNLEVKPVRDSFLVEVSYQSPDKVIAQRVVNAIGNEYMNLSIDRRKESFDLVGKWLDKQLGGMAAKVQETQKKLYKFGQQTNIYTLEPKDNVIVQKFVDLNTLLTKAQAEKMAKEAQYKEIKAHGSNSPLIVNNPLVQALRKEMVAQQAKVSSMKKVFREGHPDLQMEKANLSEVMGRLNAEVQRTVESVKADYEAASRTEKLLNDSLTAQKGEMVRLQENLSDYQILQRDAQTSEQLYQALLSRVKGTNIAATMVPSTVAVIDPGLLPNKPFKPKTLRDLSLAIILGLTLGVGIAFLLEHLDDSIKSLDDMEQAFNLPSLGILPQFPSRGRFTLSRRENSTGLSVRHSLPRLSYDKHNLVIEADRGLVVSKQPFSQSSEAFLHVYSSLMFSTSGRPLHAIMITSPNPSEGKTTVATNLAQAYALNQRHVVLIDGDLRNPKIHKTFQLELQPGLSDYLTGSATLEEVIYTSTIPNLSVIPAGTQPPNPGNLFNSATFKNLLTMLRQQFPHIIIDMPPVLGFADARFVSPLVDGVLLVAKYRFTHKIAGRLARQLLSQAPVLGVVLNSVHASGQTYYDFYKYYSKYYDQTGT
jgi:succinoglycan biosynthesis transport protein ExoP